MIPCAQPQASTRAAVAFCTRENTCSLVIPGEAIATPCDVHSTPIDRGDEQSRQATMPYDCHPTNGSEASPPSRSSARRSLCVFAHWSEGDVSRDYGRIYSPTCVTWWQRLRPHLLSVRAR